MLRSCPSFRKLQIPLLLLIALLSCGKPAFARTYNWHPAATHTSLSRSSPHPAICRVSATSGHSVSLGSGSLITVADQYGIVITNWHVVREATGEISVVFPGGFHSSARILKVDRDWDLAALAIRRPDITPIELASAAPRRGEPLTIAGYGSGQYRALTGRCTQYVSPGERLPFQMVEVSVPARQGDSGGPILNQNGKLAGVLFGAGANTTTGSYVGRVRLFLNSLNIPVEDDRTMIAQQVKPRQTKTPRRGSIPPQHGVPLVREEKSGSAEVASTATSPNFRTPRVSAPARTPTTADIQPVGWTDIAGDTIFEQVKSGLALIGVLALLVMGLRRSS